MKRFLLFAGDTYYPGGGWDDFLCDFETKDQAISRAALTKSTYTETWWQVVDGVTGKIVKRGRNSG